MGSPEPWQADAASPVADGTAYLMNDRNVQRYCRSLRQGVDRVARKFTEVDRPVTGASADVLEKRIFGIDLDEPLRDSAVVLEELEELYLRDAVYFHHPRHLGHLNCPVVIPAVLGEAVLSAINSSMDTWDQSMGATLIEQRLIRWTADAIGLGESADGVFTSGGTQSNLQALALARDEACAAAGDGSSERSTVLPRLRILASECSHFSVSTSASLLGLERNAVRSVPCDEHRRMSPDALSAELARARAEGAIVMAVVATAGTTDFGSIDPLPEIAEVCAGEGTWMHVDAAYGCGLLLSRRRHLLDGIERADSVTVDYHKSFFQPVSSSAVLVRDRSYLRHVTYHADYLNPADVDEQRSPNQVDKSLQTTRRFDALKLWLTLRVMGADALGDLFDKVVTLADEAWAVLESDRRFTMATKPQLSTLVFRYAPGPDLSPDLVDRMNRHARQAVFDSGEAVVAGTVVDGRHHLKITLLNPLVTLDDIHQVLDLLAGHAEDYLAEHPRHLQAS